MARIDLEWNVLNDQAASASFMSAIRGARDLRRELELLARAQRQTGRGPVPPNANRDLNQFTRNTRQAARAAEDLEDAVEGASGGFDKFLSNLASGVAYGIADRGLQLVIDAIQGLISATVEFGRESIDVATQTRVWTQTLTAVLGSSEAAAEGLRLVQQTASEFGVEVGRATDRYVALTSAAKTAGLEQEQINDLFRQSTRGFQIFGISGEIADRAVKGLTDSLALGTINAENYRGQILEAFPQAPVLVAEALGISVRELNQQLEGGQFSARTFTLALTEGLRNVQGEIDPSIAALANLNSIVREVQLGLGNILLSFQTAGAGALTDIIDTARAQVDLQGLEEAANRFTRALEENPEVLENIGRALGEIADLIVDDLVAGIEQFSQFLEENPGAVREFAQEFVTAFRSINELTVGAVSTFNSILGAINGIRDRIQAIGRATGLKALNDAALRAREEMLRVLGAVEAVAGFIGRLTGVARLDRPFREAAGSSAELLTNVAQMSIEIDNATDSFAQQFQAAEATADELERARDAAREQAEIEFNEAQGRGRIQERRQAQAETRAFNAQQSQQREQLEEQLRTEQATFNRNEAEIARRNEAILQEFRKQGARDIEDAQTAAANRINQLNADAAQQISDRRAEGEAEISELRQQIERDLQLQGAESPEARAELERQFQEQDEIAERRAEAFAPVREAERELEEELNAIRLQNEQEVAEVRLESEESISKFRISLQEAEQVVRLEQESALAERRRVLDEAQALVREESEARLAAAQLSFVTRQEDAKFQAQLDRQASQREFEAQQRQLDEASAERVERIRSSVGVPSTQIPAFKDGGVTTGEAGGLAITGEVGPEIGIYPAGTRFLSNQQSAAIALESMKRNPALASPFLAPMGAGRTTTPSRGGPALSNSLFDPRLTGLMASGNSLLAEIAANTQSRQPFSQVLRSRQSGGFGGRRW